MNCTFESGTTPLGNATYEVLAFVARKANDLNIPCQHFANTSETDAKILNALVSATDGCHSSRGEKGYPEYCAGRFLDLIHSILPDLV